MSKDKKPPTGGQTFAVDEAIKSNVQPIRQEKPQDRPKPVTPPPKKK